MIALGTSTLGTHNFNKTLAEFLQNSAVAPVFLAEITAGKHIPVWNYDTDNTWYATSDEDYIHVLKVNNVAQTVRNSIQEVRDNAGSWYLDMVTGLVYIHLLVDANPNEPGTFVQPIYKFYISDKAIEKNGVYYNGYISSLPSLSLRIDKSFGSIVQFGSGSLSFKNEDGFWDNKSGYDWDAGEVTLKIGTVELNYLEFVVVGSWYTDSIAKANDEFRLNLKEKKIKINKEIPFDIYTREEYPALRNDDVGKPKQWALGGPIYGARPVCINGSTGLFKLADHRIDSVLAIRVLDGEAWRSVSPVSVDLAQAEFVLDPSDWNLDDNQSVSVDLNGIPNDGGYLINNGADIVSYILDRMGIVEQDLLSFADSREFLDRGYVGYDTSNRYCVRVPSIYLDKKENATAVLQRINKVTNAYIFVDASGNYRYKIFTPKQANGLMTFTEKDILTFHAKTIGGLKTSTAQIEYGRREQDEWGETFSYSRPGSQYLRNQERPVTLAETADISNFFDVQRYSQQIAFEGSVTPIAYDISVKWEAWTLNAGDFIHFVYPRHGIDQVFEISEIKYDLTSRNVSLTITNMHGLTSRQGFWVDSDSNWDWDNVSSVWTKAERQQNSGHWHSNLDVATSGIATQQDYKISVWS